MSAEPHFTNYTESVGFEAEMHGHPVKIEIGRETIEDRVRAESMTPDELLDFVKRNLAQITENVRGYIRHAPDVTGIHVHGDLLAHCD